MALSRGGLVAQQTIAPPCGSAAAGGGCSLVEPGARGQQAMRVRSHDRRHMHPRCSVGCEANESPDWILRSPAVHPQSARYGCSLVEPGARVQQAMRLAGALP